MAIKAKMDEFLSDIKSVTSMPLFTLSPAKKIRDDGEGKKDEKMKTRFLEAFNNIRYDLGNSVLKKDIPIWILGVCHHTRAVPDQVFELEEDDMPVFDTALAKRVFTDLGSRPWFTYRKNFPPINGTDITSDTGWGCMLRSAQMMVAQGLIIHFLGRDWRWLRPQSPDEKTLHRMILGWFIDDPGVHCPLSIHHLSEIGRVYGNIPGNWYGPNTVSYIMREAVERAKEKVHELRDIVVYVAQDCTIYSGDVYDLCGWGNISKTDSGFESPKLPQKTRSESPTTSTSSECCIDEIASEACETQSYITPTSGRIVNNMRPMTDFMNTEHFYQGFEAEGPYTTVKNNEHASMPTGYFSVEHSAPITFNHLGNEIALPQTNNIEGISAGSAFSTDPEPWVKIPSRHGSQKSALNGEPSDNKSGEPYDSLVYLDEGAPPPNSGANMTNCRKTDKVKFYDKSLNEARSRTAQHVNPKKSKINRIFEGLVTRPSRSGKPRPRKNLKQAGRELKDFKQTSMNNTTVNRSQIAARILPQSSEHAGRYADASKQHPEKFEYGAVVKSSPVDTDSHNKRFLSDYIEKSVSEDSDKSSLDEKKAQIPEHGYQRNFSKVNPKVTEENPMIQNSLDTRTEPVNKFIPISNAQQTVSLLNSTVPGNGQSLDSEVVTTDKLSYHVENDQLNSDTTSSNRVVNADNVVNSQVSLDTSAIDKLNEESTFDTLSSLDKGNKCSQNDSLSPVGQTLVEKLSSHASLPHCEGSHGDSLTTDGESSILLNDASVTVGEITADDAPNALSHVDNDAQTPPTVSRNTSSKSRRRSSTLGEARVPEEARKPLQNSTDNPEDSTDVPTKAALILVPVRLGESALNPIYAPCITGLMTLESSIGIIGGKPKHSLYFVGHQDENLVHLDPHYCQTADTPTGYKKNLHNYHTMSVRKINVKKIDPSCCLGFYCRNPKEFEKFKKEGCKTFSPPQQPVSYPMCLILEGRSGDHQIHSPLERKSSGTEVNTVKNIHLPIATTVEENSSDYGFEAKNPLPGTNFSVQSINSTQRRLKKSKNEGFSIDDVGSKLNKLNPFPMLMRQKSSSPLSRRKKLTKEESLESQFELL